MNIWIINPYGTLPDEGWRTYRSTMIAHALEKRGHTIHQFISNFEHRSKTFRSKEYKVFTISENYIIHIIPSKPYVKHISLDRVNYERSFGENLIPIAKDLEKPDVVILAEPAICYFDILLNWIKIELKAKLIIDVIDIWPELFHLIMPKQLDFVAKSLLYPLYWWRKKLYLKADGLIAVSKNYLDIGMSIKEFKEPLRDIVYWSIPEKKIQIDLTAVNDKIKKLVLTKKEKEVWCIYAGTLGENYDIHSIITVGNLLKEKYSADKFKLIIAGDGPLYEYCSKKADNITTFFLGRLDSINLEFLLKSCDIALSTYKGLSTVSMPIKAFDYLAFGLPLINSLKRDLGYFVKTNHVGINYEAESSCDLFLAICNLVDDTEKRLKMSKNAFDLSLKFSESKQYANFVKVVENVVNDN